MWLHVGPSNNDPAVILRYYLDCVEEIKGKILTLSGEVFARKKLFGSTQSFNILVNLFLS